MVDVARAVMMLFSPAGRVDPYPAYAELREAGPVLKSPIGAWMITRHEPVDRVLRSPAFRTPRGFRDANDAAGPPRIDPDSLLSHHRRQWLLFQAGDVHARLRKLIAKAFTPRIVRALAPRIESLVGELLAPVLDRGGMETIADLAYPLPATVICELLGIPAADRERNRAWAAATVATVDLQFATDAQIAAAATAMSEWDPYIRALLAEKRARPGTSLLDDLLSVEDEGARLTEDEITSNATFLFLAGHETTTNLIGNGLLALLRHPDQLRTLYGLYQQPAAIENALEELLRYDSPVQIAPRVAIEPIEIEGVTLPPEVPIALMLGGANRDPRRYDRPDQLDVLRPDPKPLSFGGGAHYCVGAALARMEAKHAFSALLSATRGIELADDHIAWRPQLGLRGLERLAVTFAH